MSRARRPGAEYLSQEWRDRVGAGLRRYHQRRRASSLLRPSHVDQWLRSGVIAPALRPILKVRADQVEEMIEDLGGATEVTSMQRRVLDGWLQAQTIADVLWQRLAQNPKAEVPDKLLSAVNSSRTAMATLGLHRRTKDANQSLAEIITSKAQAAQDADEAACVPLSSTNASDSAPAHCPVDDGGSDEERTS